MRSFFGSFMLGTELFYERNDENLMNEPKRWERGEPQFMKHQFVITVDWLSAIK